MRKKNARPLPRLHKRSGNARVRIGGREHWLGKHGSPEAEARYNALLAEHEAGVKEPRSQEPPPAEAFNRWTGSAVVQPIRGSDSLSNALRTATGSVG